MMKCKKSEREGGVRDCDGEMKKVVSVIVKLGRTLLLVLKGALARFIKRAFRAIPTNLLN